MAKTYSPKIYTINWEKPIYEEHYGIKCKLPTPQPDRDCINYGLPAEKQKFHRTIVPDDLFYWQFQGDDRKEEMEKFIADEYHRRKNGIWIFIKGQKFYIPGVMYYFLNFWVMEKGNKPTFKITDLYFFIVWFHVVNDPLCYGLIDFKPRRIGDTEKVICILYEYATRVKNSRCGMQSFTEDHIKETFTDRMIYAHDRMVWFMKPINRGSTNPQEGLILDYPVTFNSAKAIKERIDKGESATTSSDAEYAYPPLKSKIDYKASKAKAYDGKLVGRYYMDEFGKMEEMDPNEAWGLVKMALKDETTDMICGKAIFTSTIEEIGKDGKSLDMAKELCDNSDPNERDENGETTSGLYRILRTYEDKAPVDEWGFPKLEIVRIKRENKIRDLLKKRKMTDLFRYQRQNPASWDDVFLSTQEKSGMDVEKLLTRQQVLKECMDAAGNKKKPKWFRGNFEWKDNIKFGEVILVPNEEGRFWFSWNGLPKDHGAQANATSHSSLKRPGNLDLFCGGVDPYEEKDSLERHPSKGGIAIRSLKNVIDAEKVILSEDDLMPDLELGDPLNYGAEWLTNKYMCVYLFRHNDPNEFYEDGLMAALFYGIDLLIEKNKGRGMISYFEQNGYGAFVQDRPEFTKTDYSKDSKEQAITAVEGTIELYFKLLKTESVKWSNTIDIPIVIQQIATLNWQNRGKKDLAVACGWSHVAAMRNVSRRNREKQEGKKNERKYYEEYVV